MGPCSALDSTEPERWIAVHVCTTLCTLYASQHTAATMSYCSDCCSKLSSRTSARRSTLTVAGISKIIRKVFKTTLKFRCQLVKILKK